MKNSLLLVLVLLASACGKDDAKPTNLNGAWKFSTSKINGEFNISSGKVTSGHYTAGGSTHQVTVAWAYQLPDHLDLVEKDGETFLIFSQVEASADFTTMTAHGYFYDVNAGTAVSSNETVVISRK